MQQTLGSVVAGSFQPETHLANNILFYHNLGLMLHLHPHIMTSFVKSHLVLFLHSWYMYIFEHLSSHSGNLTEILDLF